VSEPIIPSVPSIPSIDDIRRVVREEIQKALEMKELEAYVKELKEKLNTEDPWNPV